MRALKNRWLPAGILLVSIAALVAWRSATRTISFRADVRPNLEDVAGDGAPYTPATQSYMRTHHWLDSVKRLRVDFDAAGSGTVDFQEGSDGHQLCVENLDVSHLVPRLHYAPPAEPDAFDAFNLMLAEYSRNAISVPHGHKGDATAHFVTSLQQEVSWNLKGDYQFEPNPLFRPVRVSVVNNCLAPGLWELSAVDGGGEIYHSWFDFPAEAYIRLTAQTNYLDERFTREALKWSIEPVELDLNRLRRLEQPLGQVPFTLMDDADVGFSSQGSRRKLHKGYVTVGEEDDTRIPTRVSELTSEPVRLSEFVAPGKYSLKRRRVFDLKFLAKAVHASMRRVTPLTSYRFDSDDKREHDQDYLEVWLDFGQYAIVLGNLPEELLVPQEDFALHGFGVGILSSNTFAERRKLLFERGPAPSFAYLLQRDGDGWLALNSHDHGLEQIFIRTHSLREDPWLEITLTSYERIVDLVKYRVDLPAPLHAKFAQQAREYISPVYRTYRDDNLQ